MKKEIKNIKTPGFTSPENYFGTLGENILDKIALQEHVPKQNPFQVPNGYFETVDKSILGKIDNQKPIGKVIPLHKNKIIRYVAAVAAVFVLAISIFQFNNNGLTTPEDYLTYSSLIESDFIDLSIIDIEYLLTDEMLEGELFLSHFNNDEIEDYLLYELYDTYLLYE